MLLIPVIDSNGDLALDAYSFDSNEINAVGIILDRSRINIVNERLAKDNKGRYGLRFKIAKREISKLESTLNLKFVGRGRSTDVTLGDEWLNADGATSFKCSRIDHPPPGCETIFADDEQEAIVKCGLIAKSKNWLGGVPTRGYC